MDSTTDPLRDDPPATPTVTQALLVAFHRDPAQVGLRLTIEPGRALELDRGAPPFDDVTLSRRHARVTLGGGALHVEDAGSRHGTFVNGEPVTRQALRPFDLVGIGELLLLVLPDDAVPGAALAAEVERAARASAPVLFTGETGAGKGHLARQLHDAGGRKTLLSVPCAALAADRVVDELFGAGERAGLLEQADGGTLLLDDVDHAPPAATRALLSFLDDGLARRSGSTSARRLDVRVVATARAPDGLPAEFLSRLRLVVRVPPLRERIAEVPGLVRALLAPSGRRAKRPLVQALLRHGYRHNVRELVALVERALLDAGDAPEVDLSRAVAEAVGLADFGAPDALLVAADGTWFRPPGGSRVILGRRENLARILAALVAAHVDERGAPRSTEDLFAAGWPGERLRGPSATGRVYVALTALRNLGLRDLLLRRDGGYLLDPAARIDRRGG